MDNILLEYETRRAIITVANGAMGTYHDGHAVDPEAGETTLFHGTRDAYIPLIARDGLKASTPSHRVHGTWTVEPRLSVAASFCLLLS